MNVIRFNQEACRNLDYALQHEWLETNGLGGFSSSSICGLNTRRYHGLLVAATKPPVGRLLLLAKLEEILLIDGRRYDLSANQYPGVVHPQGYQFQVEFRLDPFPVFTYRVEGFELEKRLFMVHGENTTVIQYELRRNDQNATSEILLEVRPLVAFRDFHSTTHENDSLNRFILVEPGMATLSPYMGLPELHLAHDADAMEETGVWYRNFEYSVERDRGLDYQEDLFNPLILKFQMNSRSIAAIIASTERHKAQQATSFCNQEIQRRADLKRGVPNTNLMMQSLAAAADQFIVQRGELKTIIAGYHWFSDWGRDTMISLPGLTLVTGRTEIARDILLASADSLDRGLLPNRFPDAGEPAEYNTADATLWFFEAIRSYCKYSGDAALVRDHLYLKLKSIVDWHIRGTNFGIGVDTDGLLNCGEPGVQLTWMDAKVGDWVVTPRYGKPVEIQALWYNALRIMESFAADFDPTCESMYAELADKAKASFYKTFWNEASGCLFDVVQDGQGDGSIRPNQIFVVSLPYTMLTNDQALQVVAVVERELLTPVGLRTLNRDDPKYRPRYEGGVSERDSAYHQGTVWLWLLGPFLTAYLKVHQRSAGSQDKARQWLLGLQEQMMETGLGRLPEIADGDFPHKWAGCISQAWSVAELLRAGIEDVFRNDSDSALQ